jgi:hypothetical protein
MILMGILHLHTRPVQVPEVYQQLSCCLEVTVRLSLAKGKPLSIYEPQTREGEGISLNDWMTSDKNWDHEPSTWALLELLGAL